MAGLFRLEVDTGSGGYGFDVTLEELLIDVEYECGEEGRDKVEEWATHSTPGSTFEECGMYITNLG